MADITMADYTGYIFLEMIKARKMADAYSRQVAQEYAQDPILKHFSVPRFKIPKMALTIPVLVSGARFTQVVSFKMEQAKFSAYVLGQVDHVLTTVRAAGRVIFTPIVKPIRIVGSKSKLAVAGKTIPLDQLAVDFWKQLTSNPDPSQPQSIVQTCWTQLFEQALTQQSLAEAYKKNYPNNELFQASLVSVLEAVNASTVIDSTNVQSLLVNPETNVVKNGSSDTSVFTIQAEMLEEGFFIRSMKDEETGAITQVVEFE
jgi:hypothetical protein